MRRLSASRVSGVRAEERQRQERVVVGQRRLEPAPVGGGVRRGTGRRGGAPACAAARRRGATSPCAVSEARQAQHRQRGAARAELRRRRQPALEHLPRQQAGGRRRAAACDRDPQRPQRPPRAVVRRDAGAVLDERPVVAHEVPKPAVLGLRPTADSRGRSRPVAWSRASSSRRSACSATISARALSSTQ